MTPNYIWRSSIGIQGDVEYPFIVITPRSTLTWNGGTWLGQIELFNYLIACRQMTDVKLNCLCYRAILETI